MTDWGSEAGHWYKIDGTPCYEIERADGKGLRPTDLRDARKLNLFPSVTTVIGTSYKPQLVRWQIDQAILAALTLPRIENEPEKAWLDRIHADRTEQARKAAERGTVIHAAMERSLTGEAVAPDLLPHVTAIWDALSGAMMPTDGLQAERTFAHPLGFGGKVDAHRPAMMVEPERPSEPADVDPGWVIDFKGKDNPAKAAEAKIYDDQAMQLAAYAVGLGMPVATCGIVFFSRTEPFAVYRELGRDEQNRAWSMFVVLLRLWKIRNRYWPGDRDF